MLKGEFTGAFLKVHDAKCSSYLDVSGIVVKETRRALLIVTETDDLKLLLKQGTVFSIDLPGRDQSVLVWGEHIVYRGSERTKAHFTKKFNVGMY